MCGNARIVSQFMAALFTIVQSQKQPRGPSIGEKIYSHSGLLLTNKKKLLIGATTALSSKTLF